MSYLDRSVPRGDREETDEELGKRYSENNNYHQMRKKEREEKSLIAQKLEVEKTPEQMKEEQRKLFNKKLTKMLPSCFNNSRYLTQADKYYYQKSKIEFYELLAEYIETGKHFYCQMLRAYAMHENILERMPDYIKLYDGVDYNFEKTLNKFVRLEKELSVKVSKVKNQGIGDYFKRHSYLTEFSAYMAQAWMLYLDGTHKNLFGGLIRLQKKYEQADLTDEDQITKFYCATARVDYNVEYVFKKMFTVEGLMKQTVDYCAPYYKLDNIMQLYEDLLKMIGGFNLREEKPKLEAKLSTVKKPLNKDILFIHENYRDVNRVIYQLSIAEENANYFYSNYDLFGKSMPKDLFETTYDYYLVCKRINSVIPEDGTYKRIKHDVIDMQCRAAEALNKTKDDYYELKNQIEEGNKVDD